MHYLYKHDEDIQLTHDARIENHPVLNATPVSREGEAGETVRGLTPGSYLIHEQTPEAGTRTRYLGVVGPSYTVMQLTVGAFTSDNLDLPLHAARVPATYYITLEQAAKDASFRYFQKTYGDDVLPHIMASDMEGVHPAYKQLDPNWETNTEDELIERFDALKAWWEAKGYEPLSGIASYTPCNALVRALKHADLPILHSLCPEQNWSDGKWAINHWGMPNQPYYVAADDFRKPTDRGDQNVIAMCMNSYHLYMPHVVNWGDNVLSPSHYLRWHRTVESRYQPERFTNFLLDYLKAAHCSDDPFFLIAGFEFGRVFGTASMTDHNRKGLERVIDAAKSQDVVFATASDVAAYYQRHLKHTPGKAWTQRDYLAGTRIMGKPINSGPSLGLEMPAYKAVFEHGQTLPFYHYDYSEPWSFAYNDTEAPNCHAASDRRELVVERDKTSLTVAAHAPLSRATPVAVWDAKVMDAEGLQVHRPAMLDDGRRHEVIELPAGFSGRRVFALEACSEPAAAEFDGQGHAAWKVHMIGEADRRQAILYVDAPLTEPLEVGWTAPKACQIDEIDRPMQHVAAGERVALRFNPRKPWVRLWGVEAADLTPDAEACVALEAAGLSGVSEQQLQATLEASLAGIHAEQDQWVREQIPADETVVYDIDCFGNATTQEKSRAWSLDRTVVAHAQGVVAKEYADGGLAYAPGYSYWCHPRGLHIEIENLACYRASGKPFKVYLFNVAPAGEGWRYEVTVTSGFKELTPLTQRWVVPHQLCGDAVCAMTIDPSELTIDDLTLKLRSDQTGVLGDWFQDGGFVAALSRLVITEHATK